MQTNRKILDVKVQKYNKKIIKKKQNSFVRFGCCVSSEHFFKTILMFIDLLYSFDFTTSYNS